MLALVAHIFMSPAFSLLVTFLAGWLNRHQQLSIEYLQAENAVLREQLGKRPRFTNAQRRKLARFAKRLSRKVLAELNPIVTPDTLLRWHKKLIAQKWSYPPSEMKKGCEVGRQSTDEEIEKLVISLAKENPAWGYRRIAGELKKLDCSVSFQTVANLLKVNGFDPAPKRKKQVSWKDFIRRHSQTIWATDFLTCEVWTATGLTTFYILFFIHHHSRKVVLGGITQYPDEFWMTNRARELTWEGGPMEKAGILIHDRDRKYSSKWSKVFRDVGWETKKLPPKSPNLNAYAERFVRSLKEECLDQMILIGEKSLNRAVTEFIEHYHTERPHQGIENVVPFPENQNAEQESCGKNRVAENSVLKSSRLSGLLNSYRKAA